MPSRGRIIVLILFFVVPIAVLQVRLFLLQVVDHALYAEETQRRFLELEVIPSVRAAITDRNGVVLAQDRRSFNVYLVPAEVEDATRTVAQLCRLFGRSEEQLWDEWASILAGIERRVQELASRNQREARRRQLMGRPRLVAREVSFELAALLETDPERFAGLRARPHLQRVYPGGRVASHIVGYVSPLGREEYERLEGEGYFREEFVRDGAMVISDEEYRKQERVMGVFLSDRVGRQGVERYYQKRLRGKRGVRLTQHDRFRRLFEVFQTVPPIAGGDVRLTLDVRLQQACQEILANPPLLRADGPPASSAVVLDVHNGELLAMASYPDYNPADMMLAPRPDYVLDWVFGDPLETRRPMLNRAIQEHYPCGSIFKVVTGIAAMQEGVVDERTHFSCEGYFRPDWDFLRCWIYKYGTGHGRLDLVGGLRESCNVFFYHAAQGLQEKDINTFMQWARCLGFGRKTGVDLPGDLPGILPSPDWMRRQAGRSWRLADALSLSIGQGGLAVTPLQVVRLMAFVANGGVLVTPHVALEPSRQWESLRVPLEAKTLALIRKGLQEVVHAYAGTAFKTRLRLYPVAGKTSTAQAWPGGYGPLGPEDILPNHSWFAGYYPYDEPRFAFVVLAEYGGGGSETAAPMAALLVEALEKY